MRHSRGERGAAGDDSARQGDDSIRQLIGGLKRADQEAAEGLWRRYCEKLVRLARKKLNGMPRRMLDEEDVALSVFKSLCLRARRGEFEWLADRDDLWRILVTITKRKAAAAARHEGRRKRGGRLVRGGDIKLLPDDEPSPALLASLAEQRHSLLAILPDDACRKVALLKMDGHTDREIAKSLDVVERTVRRKMVLIRTLWQEEMERGNDE